MEKTTTVTETFEWCHLCKAFDAVTEKIYVDGFERPVHTVCRNNDICWSAELAKAALESDKDGERGGK